MPNKPRPYVLIKSKLHTGSTVFACALLNEDGSYSFHPRVGWTEIALEACAKAEGVLRARA